MGAGNITKQIRNTNFEGKTFKNLSIAAIASAVLSTSVYAEEVASNPVVLGSAEANNLLSEKPVTTPTLNYLKSNNILIPQKEGEPITSPSSAYTITEGSEDSHAFKYEIADEDGNITSKYYNISLTDSGDGYEKGSHLYNPTGDIYNIEFNGLPYSSENGGGAIYNGKTVGNIIGKFVDNSALLGGAIYNYWKDATIGNITGDFIGNQAYRDNREALGGAIYSSGTIGNVTGDFIENHVHAKGSGGAAQGGAIYTQLVMGNITGDFIKNHALAEGESASGGAIFNQQTVTAQKGIIGNITSNFIKNYVQAPTGSYKARGGAIFNWNSTIGNITGDFINNYAIEGKEANGGAIYNENAIILNISGNFIGNQGKNSYTSSFANAFGGAIHNSGTDAKISDVTGNFIGNSVYTNYGTVKGGAIYNKDSTIKDITGDFIGNYAYTNYTLKNYGSGYGGAIYNEGTIEQIVNSNFIDNFVLTGKVAQGGAIWTNKDLNIVADNGSSTFKGNFVQIGSGTEEYEAIYVAGSATLKLIARNNGVLSMYDNINGANNGYKVNISGDETGTLNLYNDIKNADVTVEKVMVNLANEEIHDYTFKSLASDESADYVIDIDLQNKKADTITTTNASNGVVTIADLHIINAQKDETEESYVIQILKTPSDALQLALSQEKYESENSKYIYDKIKSTTLWNDKYKIFDEQTKVHSSVALATTTTTNDSIKISDIEIEKALVDKGLQGDTLALWNVLDTEEIKNFNFNSANNEYIVANNIPETSGLGETKGSELNVNGVIDEKGNRSTINLNKHSGFEIKSPTTFNANNVTLTEGFGKNGTVINVTNPEAKINLTNVNIVNNISTGMGGTIYSNADVNITANNGTSEFSGNITGGKSNAIYMDGADLNLFAANSGVITFDDGIDGENYNINVTADEVTALALEDNETTSSNKIVFNNLVDNVTSFNLASGATIQLGKNAEINTKDYTSDGTSALILDIAVNAENREVQSGIINVEGTVSGKTKVFVNPENSAAFKNAMTKFVSANNFEGGTADQFEVTRVIGSPHKWRTVMNADTDDIGSQWYLSLTDEQNPDIQYVPEIAAYAGLLSAAVEQNRSIANSVAKGISYRNDLSCYEKSCDVTELMPKKQAWIDITYENAEIDLPAEMDAKINGTTFGLDLYNEGTRRAGLFGAYRYGKYDLSGKGIYYAATSSDIKNKSYLGGTYYQYDDTEWLMTGIAFAGKQNMDIKTADRVAKADTNATQYGASAEVAKRYEVRKYLNLEPSIGMYYTMLDVDSLHDNVGKYVEFDDLHYLEAELGLKIEHIICNDGETNRLYMKPSVIRTFSKGGKVKISGIEQEIKSYKDATLGRIEVGGNFGMNKTWNSFVNTGYTFGENYKAYDITVGIGYRF